MVKYLLLISISLIFSFKGICNINANAFVINKTAKQQDVEAYQEINAILSKDSLSNFQPKHQRLKAAILAITLGVFGVDRIYLGTSPIIPIAYTLTLGGFVIIPIIDTFVILFTKHFDRLKNNKQFFMWIKNKQ